MTATTKKKTKSIRSSSFVFLGMEAQSEMSEPTICKGQLSFKNPSLKDLTIHAIKPVSMVNNKSPKLFPIEYAICYFFLLAYH